tara:strand:- start:396 stop:851 length:456 start_codon:yes stop_codon:yes gene_type:complete
MAEDFDRVFAENGGKTAISDIDYADGWDFIGDNPPEVEDFNSVMNEQDKKLSELNGRATGENWANVTGSRAAGVTYTNNGGTAIAVNVVMSGVAVAQGARLVVGGVIASRFSLNSGSLGFRLSLCATVPSGESYIVDGIIGTSVDVWSELS